MNAHTAAGALESLEKRGTPYVARVKNNPVLDRMAESFLKRPAGRPLAETGTRFAHLTSCSDGATAEACSRNFVCA